MSFDLSFSYGIYTGFSDKADLLRLALEKIPSVLASLDSSMHSVLIEC